MRCVTWIHWHVQQNCIYIKFFLFLLLSRSLLREFWFFTQSLPLILSRHPLALSHIIVCCRFIFICSSTCNKSVSERRGGSWKRFIISWQIVELLDGMKSGSKKKLKIISCLSDLRSSKELKWHHKKKLEIVGNSSSLSTTLFARLYNSFFTLWHNSCEWRWEANDDDNWI